MNIPINSTTKEGDYSLFSIRQAVHACNLSCSSLIRLEEKGLLTACATSGGTNIK